jgi:putative transposase
VLFLLKTGPFAGRVFRSKFPWLDEELRHESFDVHGRAEKRSSSSRATKARPWLKAGISQATYFNWKKKYAGLMPSEMRRLRVLEDENSRLKKIVADLTLDREMLQEVIKRKL